MKIKINYDRDGFYCRKTEIGKATENSKVVVEKSPYFMQKLN